MVVDLWPDVRFYDRQIEIIRSVITDDETFVVAGHQLGKDFVTGFVCLWFFLTRSPCRVITTSVKDDHLRVLWGEIGRFIQTCRQPLDHKQGGPLILNHRDVRKLVNGVECKISYLRGMVSEKGEGMAGHHATHTLLVVDEASGCDDVVYERADTWAKRKLVIGNPYDCQNFFRRGVKAGDQAGADNRTYRRVLRIRADDSPNVRRELERQQGTPSSQLPPETPGVVTWAEYQKRRATWDGVRQCVGLDAEFYEGAENLLYPPAWLNRAEQLADGLKGRKRQARAIGIDPAEGGDSTSMAAVDEYGIIELVSRKTPDTSVITAEAIAFGKRHKVDPSNWVFDRGGGGKQHADRLRDQGYSGVRTVAFGEAVAPEYRAHSSSDRLDQHEERYQYVNRRAQMYGELRELLDPTADGWAIPAEYSELRRQLSVMPLLYDKEGRLRMLSKNKRGVNSSEKSLTELLGCSPDEADAVVLAIHAMRHKPKKVIVGAV